MQNYRSDDHHQLICNAGEGQRFEIGGVVFTRKAVVAGDAGPFALFEVAMPPYLSGPAAHVHRRTTEWFYVLSGTFAFTLDDETVMVRAGSAILVPPGVVHTFWNPSGSTSTLLGFCTCADCADSWDGLAALVAAEASWPPTDRSRFLALAAQHDHFLPDTRADERKL